MRRLLESMNGKGSLALRDRALLETAYSSAARRTELAGLDVPSADLVNGVLRIRGKGRKHRAVPVHPELAAAVNAWLAARRSWPSVEGTTAVFLNRPGFFPFGF